MIPEITIGIKVKFLDEKGEGIVTGFASQDIVLVSIDEGFVIPFPRKKLVPVKDENLSISGSKKTETTSPSKSGKPVKSKIKYIKSNKTSKAWLLKPGKANTFEVDLHLEEILNNTSGMSNADKIIFQIAYFEKCLQEAQMRNLKRFVVIHGVGAGRLKEEIRMLLTGKNIKFSDASYRNYGFGATDIWL